MLFFLFCTKIPEVIRHPLGENSPNLVTLSVSLSECVSAQNYLAFPGLGFAIEKKSLRENAVRIRCQESLYLRVQLSFQEETQTKKRSLLHATD
jgi:hypothetical protein